jgi:pyridoxal phosphate enzyme (YggS family)
MPVNEIAYQAIITELKPQHVTLVAVSKTKPISDIETLYNLGQRDFGENYVQEFVEKAPQLPADINWHFIGHLQSNKVKYIAPFVHLIHGVDSFKLLQEINKQALKNNRVINCLLQVHIADETTKFGFDEAELKNAMHQIQDPIAIGLKNIKIIGLMGMASFSDDVEKVANEFKKLKALFDKYAQQTTSNIQLQTLSMGMSGDYQLAIKQGSNMIRIGSMLFGSRNN